jgi:hypothetical protein
MPAASHEQYGAPHELWLTVRVADDGTVWIDLQAFNKNQTVGRSVVRPISAAPARWLPLAHGQVGRDSALHAAD